MNQDQAPYYQALQDYVDQRVVSFHMPGHQQGQGAPAELIHLLGEKALGADITQVLGMDDIFRPDGQCGQAQRLAAQAYGAERSYFLVNGSTCGNLVMFLASLNPGDQVLVARNCHCSVLAGLTLSGAQAIFYPVPYDSEMGVYHPPTPEILREAIAAHPQARALFFTSPSYYGAAADVSRLVALAHRSDLLVLVDEAWGAHLAFHPELPRSAVAAGADLVVQSSHKLTSALSQAALLHACGSRVDPSRLESCLRLLQTTSASCLLLASLDLARRQMACQGRELLQGCLELARQAQVRLAELGIPCFHSRAGVFAWDETRLVFSLAERGWSGFALERHLREQHNLQLEMSDARNGVALITLGHRPQDLELLLQALAQVPRRGGPLPACPPAYPPATHTVLSLSEAFRSPWEWLPLSQAVGRISLETISPYPPGIPWLLPGEVMSEALIEALQQQQQAGATMVGAHDPLLRKVRVASRDGASNLTNHG